MISVLVFEGGESLPCDSDEGTVSMAEWSLEEVTRVFSEHMGNIRLEDGTKSPWLEESIDWLLIDGNPLKVKDTIEIVNRNLAQAVKCPSEGGQLYLVRC